MTRSSNGVHTYLLSLLFCMLASSSLFVTAQAPPPQNLQNGYFATNFNPSMAIVIVVLISAFFFLAFFSIYVRQCSRDRDGVDGPTGAQVAMNRRQRGLDRATIETFPTMLYSEAKEHKIGKGALECAVCLSEFEEDETLRLLPKCSHVFHPDCIDAWLTGHVTCPVCRDNLAIDGDSKESTLPVDQNGSTSEREIMSDQVLPVPTEEDESREDRPEVLPAEAVVIQVDLIEEEQSRREEILELERIGSVRRAVRSKSSRRPLRFPRSHSTGHSLSSAPQTGDDLDRYTLRLPEPVLRSIIAAGKLKRTSSLITFAREGSSRAGYRGAGEDSSRGGRSVRMGMSGRWPSFLGRNLSEKISSWGIGRRGENGEGSVKKGDGEGSTKGKSGSVRFQFD